MHDDLCPCINKGDKRWCECDLIAKVRADEVERRFGWVSREDARAWFLADLRAKVEALPSAYIVAGVWVDARPSDDDEWGDKPAVLRDDVLALIDGSDDE